MNTATAVQPQQNGRQRIMPAARQAKVTVFHPNGRVPYGFASDTVTKEIIYFNMDQCRTFICSKDGPVFSQDPKNIWPKVGQMIVYIPSDDRSRSQEEHPTVLMWNFQSSFEKCLRDCTSPRRNAKRPQHPEPSFSQKPRQQWKSGRNDGQERRSCRNARSNRRRGKSSWRDGDILEETVIAAFSRTKEKKG